MARHAGIVRLAACMVLAALTFVRADESKSSGKTFRFADAWDKSQWTPVRMANQAQAIPLVKVAGGVGTTPDTFVRKDWETEKDNAIALHDLGSTEAEFAVTFTMGKPASGTGFSCPGLCISPIVKDGVVESSIAVFVADYTMAIWHQTTDSDGKTVRYRHMVQLGRWSDPAKPHTLRCRISKKEGSVALKLDDGEVIVLSFIGSKSNGTITEPVNSVVGLWGCHGECTFSELTIFGESTLPFIVRTPRK